MSPQTCVQNLKTLAHALTANAQGTTPSSIAENNSWTAERVEQRFQQLPGAGEIEFEVKIPKVRGPGDNKHLFYSYDMPEASCLDIRTTSQDSELD